MKKSQPAPPEIREPRSSPWSRLTPVQQECQRARMRGNKFRRGVKHTEEQKLALSIAHKKYWERVSPAVRQQYRKRMQGNKFREGLKQTEKWLAGARLRYPTSNFKKCAIKKGDKRPLKIRKKISEALRRRVRKPETYIKSSQALRAHYASPAGELTRTRQREMALLRPAPKRADTKIEQLLASAFRERGIIFERQVVLAKVARVDFLLQPCVVVECDGCYWHHCPTCKLNKGERGSNKERDIRKTETLHTAGYTVLRFWAHELENSLEDCIAKILMEVMRAKQPVEKLPSPSESQVSC